MSNTEQGKPLYAPAAQNVSKSHVGPSLEARMAKYQESISDPRAFWAKIADTFYWEKKWDDVLTFNYHRSKGKVFQRWFDGGITNLCYNALDRWLPEYKDQVAFYCEGNEVGESSVLTYGELHREVTIFAGVLRDVYGVRKGDVVSIYLPMVGIAPIAMLACARIGAMASVVFGGFSSHSLAARLLDSQSKVLVTADGTMRGEKPIHLKSIADQALADCEKDGLQCKCLVYERHGRTGVPMKEGRDQWYDAALKSSVTPVATVEWVEAEHPLFMLYTSGSTGKPKGLVHTTGGYMIYAATTFKYAFDYHSNEVYFCTADIGWITGHTYVVFGPTLNRAVSVLFEGLPNYPSASRWWAIVDKYQVNLFYTAPTAVRALMCAGEEPVKSSSRSSLRILGTVGEPINVAAWEWYYHVVGDGKCDIVDTWWQTETGGHMLLPLAGCTPLKPGSATFPFWGIMPAVLDSATGANLSEGSENKKISGLLCMTHPWPGQARTIYNDHARYEQTYFSYDGFYFSGDGCDRDEDGYYWLTGRVDDVMNVSGHRLGTSEVEGAVNTNPNVVESAVVGFPHDIKGEGVYVYVTLKQGIEPTADILAGIKASCREEIGPIATPDAIQPAPGLPKTRSGKIMRRILRKIATGEYEQLGDTSTLADPGVVPQLIDLRETWVLKKKKA